MCSYDESNLRGDRWLLDKFPELKDLQPFDSSEIDLLLASGSLVTLLCRCLSGHFGNTNDLSLWNYIKTRKMITELRFKSNIKCFMLLQQGTGLWIKRIKLWTLVFYRCCSQLTLSHWQQRAVWVARAQSVQWPVELLYWRLWWELSYCCCRLQSWAPKKEKPMIIQD